MDEKFWRDYRLERPGTLGGEIRRNEQSFAQPFPSAPSLPAASDSPHTPRVPYQFKKLDLVVALCVFLATWLVLWRSSNMGGGTAAAVAFFSGCLAGRWWRQLLIVFVIALALTAYFHSR
jgi:hypothetical protein